MAALGEDLRCITHRDAAGGTASVFEPPGEPGRGTPLFCIPAFALDGRSFAPLAPLAASRRVVFWNQPNDAPASGGLSAFADDALANAARAGLERPVLVGSSMGAMVALAAALDAPARVAGAVLFSGTVRWGDLGVLIRAVAAFHPLLPARPYPRVMARVLAPGFEGSDPLLAAIRRQMEHRTKTYAGRALAALRGFDLTPRLASLRVPTLVVHARRDPVSRFRTTRAFASAPGVRVVALDSASHLPFLSHPDECLRRLRDFLAEVDAAEASR